MDHVLGGRAERKRDIRAENAHQAGTRQRIREIDRDGFDSAQPAERFKLLQQFPGDRFDPVGTKTQAETDIAEKEPRGNQQDPKQPDLCQGDAGCGIFQAVPQPAGRFSGRLVIRSPENSG